MGVVNSSGPISIIQIIGSLIFVMYVLDYYYRSEAEMASGFGYGERIARSWPRMRLPPSCVAVRLRETHFWPLSLESLHPLLCPPVAGMDSFLHHPCTCCPQIPTYLLYIFPSLNFLFTISS